MKRCNKCKFQYDDDSIVFCPECGLRLESVQNDNGGHDKKDGKKTDKNDQNDFEYIKVVPSVPKIASTRVLIIVIIVLAVLAVASTIASIVFCSMKYWLQSILTQVGASVAISSAIMVMGILYTKTFIFKVNRTWWWAIFFILLIAQGGLAFGISAMGCYLW